MQLDRFTVEIRQQMYSIVGARLTGLTSEARMVLAIVPSPCGHRTFAPLVAKFQLRGRVTIDLSRLAVGTYLWNHRVSSKNEVVNFLSHGDGMSI